MYLHILSHLIFTSHLLYWQYMIWFFISQGRNSSPEREKICLVLKISKYGIWISTHKSDPRFSAFSRSPFLFLSLPLLFLFFLLLLPVPPPPSSSISISNSVSISMSFSLSSLVLGEVIKVGQAPRIGLPCASWAYASPQSFLRGMQDSPSLFLGTRSPTLGARQTCPVWLTCFLVPS